MKEYIQSEMIDTLVDTLYALGLQAEDSRVQTYDGAGNMAGITNDCAANFTKEYPKAPYFHCISYDLLCQRHHIFSY